MALAGILIPLLPSLVEKASSSAGATNLSEIVKAVQLFASQHNDVYPDQLDSIVDNKGAIASYVPNDTYGTTPMVPYQLTGPDVSALMMSGIMNVSQMVANPGTTNTTDYQNDWNPTFFPYGNDSSKAPTEVSLAGSGGGMGGSSPGITVASVPGEVAAQKFGLPATGTYVVFGLGKYSTISGVGMNQPPVWFNPMNTQDPNSVYCRFGLVFQTAGASGVALTQAKFVGAVAFSMFGLVTQDDQLSQNYSLK